jgi:hypothetical protein
MPHGRGVHFYAYTESFNEDSRELHEIPEAQRYFKALVRTCGWYGLVDLPGHLGMLCGRPHEGSTDRELQDYWMPVIAGFCPSGVLDPAEYVSEVEQSVQTFQRCP